MTDDERSLFVAPLDEPGKPVEHFLRGTRYLGWYLLAAMILGALWMLWEGL